MPVKLVSSKFVCEECDQEYIIVETIGQTFTCRCCEAVLMEVDEEDQP